MAGEGKRGEREKGEETGKKAKGEVEAKGKIRLKDIENG